MKPFWPEISELNILWTGHIPLNSIKWTLDSSKHFTFSSSFKHRRVTLWEFMINKYPKIYDGTLLVLDNFFIEDATINLIMRSMKFSQVLVYIRDKLQLPESLGPLGVQFLITNPLKTHILIGKRANASEYMPGALAQPGGMFEMSDIETSVLDACLRELHEEVNLEVNEETMTLLALYREYNLIGSNILVEVVTDEDFSEKELTQQKIEGNEEWKSNQLWWFPLSRICELNPQQIMEGLAFLQK
ncbi:MAG: NUDIX domain-containing protein [Promethearchaeota archaeon]